MLGLVLKVRNMLIMAAGAVASFITDRHRP